MVHTLEMKHLSANRTAIHMQISLGLEGSDNRLSKLRLYGLGQRHSGIRHTVLHSRQMRSCSHQVPVG